MFSMPYRSARMLAAVVLPVRDGPEMRIETFGFNALVTAGALADRRERSSTEGVAGPPRESHDRRRQTRTRSSTNGGTAFRARRDLCAQHQWRTAGRPRRSDRWK